MEQGKADIMTIESGKLKYPCFYWHGNDVAAIDAAVPVILGPT